MTDFNLDYSEPVPNQYKKPIDENILDIIESVKKLWPMTSEIGGDMIRIRHEDLIITIQKEKT